MYLSLCKHREIYVRCFFVALQLNNPRLLGGGLLSFFVGVSSAAYTEVRTIRSADE